MSIANEVQRLQSAKADIKTAIENKGVTVGDGTIDTYAAKINEISGGGGGTGPSGYWERWVEVGQQIGSSDFDWPSEKHILKDISSVDSSAYGYMPDGTPAYGVTDGHFPDGINYYAYKETYEG